MIPATPILPPPPATPAKAPRPPHTRRGWWPPARREERPEVPPPPPTLDTLAQDPEWLAWLDERDDEARAVQDADSDAEWADLPEWMHRPVGVALGVGEAVDGELAWQPWPIVGRA